MSKSVYHHAEMEVEIINYRPEYDQDDTSRVIDHVPATEMTVRAQQIRVRTPRIEYSLHFSQDESLVIEGPEGDFMFSTKFVMHHNGTPQISIDPPPYVKVSLKNDDDGSVIGG